MKKYLFFIVLSFYLTSGQAAEYNVRATIDQDAFYDDNVRLSEDREGSFGYFLTPIVYFSRNTENLQIGVDASYGVQRYVDISDLDQEFQNYGIQTIYNTEKSIWAVEADFGITPLRNNAEQDSGDFGTTAETTTWSVAPSYSYQITERDQLTLAGIYLDRSISTADPTADSLSDFTNYRVNLDWQRQWTERYSSVISVFYSRFESMPTSIIGTETTGNTYGIDFSSAYSFQENWAIAGTIGGRITESKNIFRVPIMPVGIMETREDETTLGFLSDIAVNYSGERLVGSFFWTSSLEPSTQGQLNEQQSVGMNLAYRLTQRVNATFDTSYLVTESASSDDSDERENFNIRTAVDWQITPDWTMIGAYSYQRQESDTETADSNSFTLSINYNWPGLSISR